MSKFYWSVSLNSVWVLRELLFGKSAFDIWQGMGAHLSGARKRQGFVNTLKRLEQRGMIWRNPDDQWQIRILPYGHRVLDFLARTPTVDRVGADIPGDAGAIPRAAHSVSDQP